MKVIFACVHNAGRSQMAAGFYNQHHPGEKPIPINTDTLAYRYNPDVFRDTNAPTDHINTKNSPKPFDNEAKLDRKRLSSSPSSEPVTFWTFRGF